MKIAGIITTVLASVFAYNQATAQCNVFFVTPDGTGPGTMNDPANLSTALFNADSGDIIRLSSDTFIINNPIQLHTGMTIEGGFMPVYGWAKSSQAGATHIIRTASNPEGTLGMERIVAFYGNNITQFRLQDITISTANGTKFGKTTYGIHLTKCSDYQVVRCQVFPGNGYDGVDGIDGVKGAQGEKGFSGSAGNNDDNSMSGPGGKGGKGAGTGGGNGGSGAANGAGCCKTGGYGYNGSVSTSRRSGGGGGGGGGGGETDLDGGRGGYGGGVSGVYGYNYDNGIGGLADGCSGAGYGKSGYSGSWGITGTNGKTSTGAEHVGGFYVVGPDGTDGQDGSGGQGGAGGGGGAGQGGLFCVNGSGSGGGGGGGGGEGGTAATGGTSGGGSFGIYLYSNGKNAEFIQCRVIGGTAGKAGIGGIGGIGGYGGSGGSGSYYTGGGEVGAGGNGGSGGMGGNGGNGGDGSAGESVNIKLASGTAPKIKEENANLHTQPVIVSLGHCAFDSIAFNSGAPGNWNFGTFANPSTSVGLNVVTRYSKTGRFDVSLGSETYREFVYMTPNSSGWADAGQDQSICYGEPVTLSAVKPEFGNGKWSTNSSAQFDPNDPASQVNNLELGKTTFVWTVTSDCCPDHTDEMVITVLPLHEKVISPLACISYTLPSGSATITDEGSYTLFDTIQGSLGCDTAVRIELTLVVPDIAVTQLNQHTLRSEDIKSSYQWLDCEKGYAPIAGATDRLFVAISDGSYAVELNNDGCIDTSECVVMDKVSIHDLGAITRMIVYPNPVSDELLIEIAYVSHGVAYSVTDVQGRTVLSGDLTQPLTTVDVSGLCEGLYLMRTELGYQRFQVIR